MAELGYSIVKPWGAAPACQRPDIAPTTMVPTVAGLVALGSVSVQAAPLPPAKVAPVDLGTERTGDPVEHGPGRGCSCRKARDCVRLPPGSITAGAVNTSRQQRRAALRAAAKRGTASNTCLTCGLKFASRDLYLEHVVRDHGIPAGHRIFDFEGTLYDVTSIERLAATSGNYGPFDVDLTPQIMWSISRATLDEARLRSLTPAELARPVLVVRHASHDRIIDGHHRLTRLHRDGAPMFPAFIVPEQDARQFVHRASGGAAGNG
jgi:hypothetical protein